MRNVPIGALRHRFTLEAPSELADSAGGAERTWQSVATLWGALRPMFGNEGEFRGRYTGRLTHEIILRYRSGVLPNMRLVMATRVFDIHAVVDAEARGRWLICHCEEVGL